MVDSLTIQFRIYCLLSSGHEKSAFGRILPVVKWMNPDRQKTRPAVVRTLGISWLVLLSRIPVSSIQYWHLGRIVACLILSSLSVRPSKLHAPREWEGNYLFRKTKNPTFCSFQLISENRLSRCLCRQAYELENSLLLKRVLEWHFVNLNLLCLWAGNLLIHSACILPVCFQEVSIV